MEGKRMDEEDVHDGGGHDSQIPLGPIATFAALAKCKFLCIRCLLSQQHFDNPALTKDIRV